MQSIMLKHMGGIFESEVFLCWQDEHTSIPSQRNASLDEFDEEEGKPLLTGVD